MSGRNKQEICSFVVAFGPNEDAEEIKDSFNARCGG